MRERVAAGVLVAALALFALTWTDAVQVSDSGEMIAAGCNGGVAHPPGYPLFTLLGRAFCALPFSTPAGRVALISLLAGAWTVLMVFLLVEHLTGDLFAAAVSALVLATGSIFWRHASVAEVFALNAAICVTWVYAALRRWIFVCGLLAGLVVCHHHPALFVAPVVAWLLLRAPPRPGPLLAG